MPRKERKFENGDPIQIVGGVYQRYKTGTYVGPYGIKMATVEVDGDVRKSRHLWLTSIRPYQSKDQYPKKATKGSSDSAGTIVMKKKDYDAVLDEVSELAIRVKKLELQLKALGVKKNKD